MAQTMLAVAIVVILVMCHGVSAKRGCSAFGHSCFGGHGKRSGDTGAADMPGQELIARHQMGQEETPPHPGYPGYPHYNLLQPGDDIIPIRDGGMENDQGAFDREDAGREVMKFKLHNIFKHWVDNYRRSQQNDDAYDVENIM